jgi:hypothetical protein
VTIEALITRIRTAPDSVRFDEVMNIVSKYYVYTPTRFSNGAANDQVVNEAGQNEGSCKLFAFASLHGLSEAETLACFGDYYRRDVLEHPQGTDHANIRTFMRHGWRGIHFDQPALTLR